MVLIQMAIMMINRLYLTYIEQTKRKELSAIYLKTLTMKVTVEICHSS